jgi:dimethylhistidine N-methyltransferase
MLDSLTIDQDVVGPALAGLTASPKTLPPKLFYDRRGVELFEAITRQPEYTVTRTETALLARLAPDIASLAEPGSVLVEYGASEESKALHLLDAMPGRFAAYLPIDIAADALADLQRRLRRTRPHLRVHIHCGDFQRPLTLPDSLARLPPFGFFPGSTIGNLEPLAARAFLREVRRTLGAGGWLIVGTDLPKAEAVLHAAYDDAAGVTAAFNLNMLHRLNREAAADFRPDRFAHKAVWNAAESRVEMHLVSLARQTVRLAGTEIMFAAGETIHTENSYKHSIPAFQALARQSGWEPAHVWTDEQKLFSIHALRADCQENDG